MPIVVGKKTSLHYRQPSQRHNIRRAIYDGTGVNGLRSWNGNSPVVNVGGALTSDFSDVGRAVKFNQTIATVSGANQGKRAGAQGDFFCIVVARWDTDNGDASGALVGTSIGGSAPDQAGWTLQIEAWPNNKYVNIRNVKPDQTVEGLNATDSVTSTDGLWHTYGMRVEKSGKSSVFMDGVQSSITATLTYATPPSTDIFLGGRKDDGAGFRFTGGIALVAIIPGAATDEYVRRLTVNPWAIFNAYDSNLWVPALAGGGTSINATTDILTIAEQSSTVKADTSITAGQDTLTIAEQPATIKLSPNVSALTDTLTITEQPANISLGASINATTDTLTITEQPSVIVADTSISANIDTLTITSFSASVSTGEEVATKGGQTTREQRLRKERVEKEKERLKKEATETPEFLKRILAAPTEEEIKVVQEKQEELVQEVLEQSQETPETKIIEFPKKKESFRIPKDEQIEILRNLSIVVASQKIMLQQMQKQMEIQNQLISKILEMKYVTEDEVIAIVLSLTA